MKVAFFTTEKARFIIVGSMNTVIDFGVLFMLTFLGIDKIVANYISTSCGLVFSFFANRSFTFENSNGDIKKQLLGFIPTTLIGLWILQPVVIWVITSLLSSTLHNEMLLLLIAKVFATLASLTWNYLFYSRLVFKK